MHSFGSSVIPNTNPSGFLRGKCVPSTSERCSQGVGWRVWETQTVRFGWGDFVMLGWLGVSGSQLLRQFKKARKKRVGGLRLKI